MRQRLLTFFGWLSLAVVVYVPFHEWRRSRDVRSPTDALVDSLFEAASSSATKPSVDTSVAASVAARGPEVLANCTSRPGWPTNGTVISRAPRTGRGQLRVDNGTSLDAVVVLESVSDPERTLGFFVKANAHATLTRVPTGIYHLRFLLGEDFSDNRDFCRRHFAARFSSNFRFEEIRSVESDSSYSIRYSVQTVTLHAVSGGNASTNAVDLASFEIPE